jgi:RNA polymerase sigma factor (sigma-70 family)
MEELPDKEQKELIKKAKLDRKDFDKIYLHYYKKVLDFVRKRVSDQHTAEDITGDIFEKILKSINDFQWQGITLSAWIFRIARNTVIDHYRKYHNRKNVSIDDMNDELVSNETMIETGMLEDEMQVKLYNAIREFEEEDQYLIYYKFFAEISNKEIAKLTGMSETNVGTKLHRVRKKLRNVLQKLDKVAIEH